MIRALILAVLLSMHSTSAAAYDKEFQQQVKEFFSEIDADKDGQISKEEFLRFAENHRKNYRKNEPRSYKSLDTNNDGQVSLSEMRDSVRDGRGNIIVERGNKLANLMDTDKDRFISEKEFIDYNSRTYNAHDLAEFIMMDINKDGFVDIDEYSKVLSGLADVLSGLDKVLPNN